MAPLTEQSCILSLYDLTGIQAYVFGSNRLAANLGASFVANASLSKWLAEEAGTDATVLWTGGGNAMLKSPTLDVARNVTTRLSLRVERDAPGLGLACAHAEWLAGTPFAAISERLHGAAQRHKQRALPPARFSGAGVCETCIETGEPVPTGSADEDGLPISAALQARLQASDLAEQRLHEVLGPLPEGLSWSRDIDKLGRSRGDRSLVGVLHFDGNGMGDRFQAAASAGLEALTLLSRKVEAVGAATLKEALAPLLDPAHLDRLEKDPDRGFALHRDKRNRRIIPARPIVFGGDDISLVCDGRIAVDLAARLLTAWHAQSAQLPGGAAHGCVGVALVNSHFPFHAAYELAERLCTGAKRWLEVKGARGSASALDWSLASGTSADLSDARRTVASASARPYLVAGNRPELQAHRSWAWFRHELVESVAEQEAEHTQWQALRDALWSDLEGTARGKAVDRLLDRWQSLGITLPCPPGRNQVSGFLDGETPYLDAIELIDRVVPLEFWTKEEVPQ